MITVKSATAFYDMTRATFVVRVKNLNNKRNKSMDYKQILFEERFKFNLELLDFPEEDSIGWRLALEMTEVEM